jgi:Na(+)-translocating NADH:ubiquinone oxidoreductase A subunit
MLEGRPGREVKMMAEPEVLYIPVRSRRFAFSNVCVKDGQRVSAGDILAKDPDNYNLPLLAPRAGKVKLESGGKHIVLEEIKGQTSSKKIAPTGPNRDKLLELGAWQYFYDAFTDKLPDPRINPQAIIVSMLTLEPYMARGDAQLYEKLSEFTRGLGQLQSLLEYQPIYLVMPNIKSAFAMKVREQIRGLAWAKLVEVELKYPYDNFEILARGLGIKSSAGVVWGIRTEGVLAVDKVLSLGEFCDERVISIGGPLVNDPVHVRVVAGYPIAKLVEKYVSAENARVINGGVFTGRKFEEDDIGIDTECRGLTILAEHEEREFLGFVRPGWDRACYVPCYLSAFRGPFEEKLTTAVKGELRPCISCNYCEEVCPAGIMPHLIHKYLYRDLLEEADRARVDLCVECGLCSFVCPSKIDLRNQFVEAKVQIEQEKEELRLEKQSQERLREQEKMQRQKVEENS